LRQYRDYLLVERGLAASTAALDVRLARPFLATRVRADGRLDLAGLGADEVAAFVVAQSRQQPRSAKRIVAAVRSLLRFAHVAGLIDQPLAEAGGLGVGRHRLAARRADRARQGPPRGSAAAT